MMVPFVEGSMVIPEGHNLYLWHFNKRIGPPHSFFAAGEGALSARVLGDFGGRRCNAGMYTQRLGLMCGLWTSCSSKKD